MPQVSAALTTKQRKYVQGRKKGWTKRESATKAGYSKTTSTTHCIEKPAVKQAFALAMQHRIASDDIAKTLKRGLSAKRTEFFDKDGVVQDERTTIDWKMRLEYAKVAAEYAGYVDPNAPKIEQTFSMSILSDGPAVHGEAIEVQAEPVNTVQIPPAK